MSGETTPIKIATHATFTTVTRFTPEGDDAAPLALQLVQADNGGGHVALCDHNGQVIFTTHLAALGTVTELFVAAHSQVTAASEISATGVEPTFDNTHNQTEF